MPPTSAVISSATVGRLNPEFFKCTLQGKGVGWGASMRVLVPIERSGGSVLKLSFRLYFVPVAAPCGVV